MTNGNPVHCSNPVKDPGNVFKAFITTPMSLADKDYTGLMKWTHDSNNFDFVRFEVDNQYRSHYVVPFIENAAPTEVIGLMHRRTRDATPDP